MKEFLDTIIKYLYSKEISGAMVVIGFLFMLTILITSSSSGFWIVTNSNVNDRLLAMIFSATLFIGGYMGLLLSKEDKPEWQDKI